MLNEKDSIRLKVCKLKIVMFFIFLALALAFCFCIIFKWIFVIYIIGLLVCIAIIIDLVVENIIYKEYFWCSKDEQEVQ